MKDIQELEQNEAITTIPVSLVPTPTKAYRTHRKMLKTTVEPGMPVMPQAVPLPRPIPAPAFQGARVLMWKQDPSVSEIGVRKAYLPGAVFSGPRDARIINGTPGIPPVIANAFGDMIETPGTPTFDAVHTFAVVRQTLTMFQRARAVGGQPAQLPWQWNSPANTDPLMVFPHAGVTANAYYSRSERALKFFHFQSSTPPPSHTVYTCRSFDIVAHETGHAILDGLKPGWLTIGNVPQTGGLHESFADLSAIFLVLSQFDQVEAIIAQTKGNLHDKTFLADLAEEFGLALGRPNGLRNADNDLKLSQVGNEVHAISQVFTGAIYDMLADLFAFERKSRIKDDAAVLYEVAQYLCSLVLRAMMAAPASNATFAHIANQMLSLAFADGKPAQYRTVIRNRFVVREVVVSPVPLHQEYAELAELKPGVQDEPGAWQNRSGCCGTMNLGEYTGAQEALDEDLKELVGALR